MGTSCIFLFLTLIVYLSLPVLQNLHGKTLMCHIASLLVGYLCLAVIPWITEENDSVTPCGIVGNAVCFLYSFRNKSKTTRTKYPSYRI